MPEYDIAAALAPMRDDLIAGRKRIEQLEGALKECSAELAEWVTNHYAGSTMYPTQQRRYDRDMEPVVRARALLVGPVGIEPTPPPCRGGALPLSTVTGVFKARAEAAEKRAAALEEALRLCP